MAVVFGRDEGGEPGGDGHRDNQPDAADERGDDLDGDDFAVRDGPETLRGEREQDEQGERCAGIASARVLTVEEMWSRPMRRPDRYSSRWLKVGFDVRSSPTADAWVTVMSLSTPHAEDHAREHEPFEIDVGVAERDEQRVLVLPRR